jgi:MATE family multidrug resistance protein
MPAGRETAGQRASLASKTLSAPVSNVVITASAGGLRPLIASPVGGRCSGRFFGSRTRSAAAVRVLRLWTETGRIVAAASPVALIGLLNMMLGLTDMVMVGRYDPTGLGAIVVVGDLNSIVFNFTAGFAGVVAPYVAAAIGARVPWQVCTIVKRIVLLVSILALAGTVVIWNAVALLETAGVRLEDAATTQVYARYMAAANLLMVLFAFGRHALSAVGRSRFAVVAIVLALPLNAVANEICMNGAFGWHGMGAAGAGFASLVVAVLIGGSVTAFLFLSRSFDHFREVPAMPRVLAPRELVRLARPATLMGLAAIAETGTFLCSTILIGVVASNALVAHGLAFRSMAICYLLLAGLGQAVTIRIAFLDGRASGRRERDAHRAIAVCAVVLVLLLASLFVLASGPIATVMTRVMGVADDKLVAEIAGLVPLAGLALAAAVPAHLISAFLRAKKRALAAMTILAVGHSGVGLLSMAFLGVAGLGATGVWAGLLLGAAAASTCGFVYLHQMSGPTRMDDLHPKAL